MCCPLLQEEEIQKAIFVGNYDGAVDTCLKAGRLADALLIANIGGAELFKKTMQRYMRRNPRPYMAVRGVACVARTGASPTRPTPARHSCACVPQAETPQHAHMCDPVHCLPGVFSTHACNETVSFCCVCRACRSSLPWLTVITCRWSRHAPWGSGVRPSLCWQHTQVRSGIRSVALVQPPAPVRCVAADYGFRLLAERLRLSSCCSRPALAQPCCLLVC